MKSDTPVGLPEPKSDTFRRAERLQQLLAEGAEKRREVADRLGIPVRTLNEQARRGSMRIDAAVQIAEATGVSLDWLLAGRGPMRPGEDATPGPMVTGGPSPGFVSIPRYDVRASAGNGVTVPGEYIIESIVLSEDYIRRVLRRDPRHMRVLEVLGDSMEPTLRSGDFLMIDVSITGVRAASLYVVRLDDLLMVKRIQPRMDGSVRIVSDNKDYEPEVLTPSEQTPLHVVGEVVVFGGPLRSTRA